MRVNRWPDPLGTVGLAKGRNDRIKAAIESPDTDYHTLADFVRTAIDRELEAAERDQVFAAGGEPQDQACPACGRGPAFSILDGVLFTCRCGEIYTASHAADERLRGQIKPRGTEGETS